VLGGKQGPKGDVRAGRNGLHPGSSGKRDYGPGKVEGEPVRRKGTRGDELIQESYRLSKPASKLYKVCAIFTRENVGGNMAQEKFKQILTTRGRQKKTKKKKNLGNWARLGRANWKGGCQKHDFPEK